MGITDMTTGGVQPIRVETPQVSSPAPQRVPKTEGKAPTPSQAPQIVTPDAAGASMADTAAASEIMQSNVQRAQTGAPAGTAKDADRGVNTERASKPQRANRADGPPVQNGQRVSRQQEEKKAQAGQDSYYEKVMAEKAMENAKERLRSLKHNVRFGYNDEIERYTITITDADKEVVKEIPSEETQKMIEHLHTMRGMMFETGI